MPDKWDTPHFNVVAEDEELWIMRGEDCARWSMRDVTAGYICRLISELAGILAKRVESRK